VLEAAEPDAWGRQVRAARLETDAVKRQAALEALAKSARVAELPARALARLAGHLSPPQAAQLLRRAQQHYTADFWVNHNLGMVPRKVTPPQRDEAVRFLTAAVALRPESPGAHLNLSNALKEKGQLEEAIASYHKAIALDPNYAAAHNNLGGALKDKGEVGEATASSRKAIALDPRFAGALSVYKRGHELGSKQSGWNYPSAGWVRLAERLAALEAKLPAFLKGEHKPTDTAECLGLLCVCQARKLHHAATRLCADAFAADVRLADDLNAGHRYNAACSAALAAAGQGQDAGKLDDRQRVRLRQQALDWLRADLTLLNTGEVGRSRVARVLSYWQKDAYLAGLRDKAALEKLPAQEQKAWTQLWSDWHEAKQAPSRSRRTGRLIRSSVETLPISRQSPGSRS
jgi:tetratricopeptide (TPR) repeat protein